MPAKNSATKLNPGQETFVQSFMAYGEPTFGNATESYLMAYPNTSRKSATASGYRLLGQPQVQAYLDKVRKDTYTSSTLSRQESREILAGIARANIADYVDADGNIVPEKVKKLGKVKSFQRDDYNSKSGCGTRCKIELGDPIAAVKADAELGGYKQVEKKEIKFLGILRELKPTTGLPTPEEIAYLDEIED